MCMRNVSLPSSGRNINPREKHARITQQALIPLQPWECRRYILPKRVSTFTGLQRYSSKYRTHHHHQQQQRHLHDCCDNLKSRLSEFAWNLTRNRYHDKSMSRPMEWLYDDSEPPVDNKSLSFAEQAIPFAPRAVTAMLPTQSHLCCARCMALRRNNLRSIPVETGVVCKIWCFHGGDYEECRLLGYKTQFVLHRTHITSPLQSPAG
jgi:hypothetical protein